MINHQLLQKNALCVIALIIIFICIIATLHIRGISSPLPSNISQVIPTLAPEQSTGVVQQNTSELLHRLGPCKDMCYSDFQNTTKSCELQYNTTGMVADERYKYLNMRCYAPAVSNRENCYSTCDDLYYPEEERVIVQKTLSACYDNCTYEWSELRCVRLYNVTRQNLSTVNATVAAQYEQCAHMLSGTVGDCMAICGQQYYVPQTPVPVRTPIQTTQLNIVTDPSGSAVKIDGIDQQVKTPASLPIKAGTHTVTLVLDGYRNYSIIFDSSPFETWNITHTFELTSSAQR